MSGRKIALLIVPTVVSALFIVGWSFALSRAEKKSGASAKALGMQAKAPDAQLRDLMGNPKTRLATAIKAGEEKQRSAIVLLQQSAINDPDPEVRAACVRSMGQIGDAGCAQPVIKSAADIDLVVRLAAIEAMGRIHSPACESELIRQLNHEDREIRCAAAATLAAYRNPVSSQALVRALRDEESRFRVAIADELGMRTDPEARAGLARAVTDVKAAVRETAAKGLARDTAPGDYPALCKALLDEEKSVRDIALPAVRRIGKPLVPDLAKAFHPRVGLEARQAAVALLREIGGLETVPALVRTLDKVGDKPPKGM